MVLSRSTLLLSAQRALLGAIDNSILGICIVPGRNSITMNVFADQNITEEEIDNLDIACTEMIADLYPPWIVELQITITDTLPKDFTNWVFVRAMEI